MNKIHSKFKATYSLEERKNESSRILREYTNRMPVICEVAPNSKLKPLEKTKYLVPYDMIAGQFQFLIRRNLDLEENSAIYIFTPDNKTIQLNKTMMEVYNIHKDKQDNFLYLLYDSEETFG